MTACPASANLTVEAGILWALEGDFEKAATVFLRHSQLAPEWNVPLLALGVTQLYQAGKLGESSDISESLRAGPERLSGRVPYATALSHAAVKMMLLKKTKSNQRSRRLLH